MTNMQPLGPLRVEHRLIERMIALMKAEVTRLQVAEELDPAFMETAVDFIRVYADRTHHGKEEDIFFRDLAAKNLAPEHAAMMRDLIAEHEYARNLTRSLIKAGQAHAVGEKDALGQVISLLLSFTEFYPRHILMEDDRFFPAVMVYLDEGEQETMLERFRDFDRSMIHLKYRSVVEKLETGRR